MLVFREIPVGRVPLETAHVIGATRFVVVAVVAAIAVPETSVVLSIVAGVIDAAVALIWYVWV